jgi:hypothetical protein
MYDKSDILLLFPLSNLSFEQEVKSLSIVSLEFLFMKNCLFFLSPSSIKLSLKLISLEDNINASEDMIPCSFALFLF